MNLLKVFPTFIIVGVIWASRATRIRHEVKQFLDTKPEAEFESEFERINKGYIEFKSQFPVHSQIDIAMEQFKEKKVILIDAVQKLKDHPFIGKEAANQLPSSFAKFYAKFKSDVERFHYLSKWLHEAITVSIQIHKVHIPGELRERGQQIPDKYDENIKKVMNRAGKIIRSNNHIEFERIHHLYTIFKIGFFTRSPIDDGMHMFEKKWKSTLATFNKIKSKLKTIPKTGQRRDLAAFQKLVTSYSTEKPRLDRMAKWLALALNDSLRSSEITFPGELFDQDGHWTQFKNANPTKKFEKYNRNIPRDEETARLKASSAYFDKLNRETDEELRSLEMEEEALAREEARFSN